jgi:hypothetical protein
MSRFQRAFVAQLRPHASRSVDAFGSLPAFNRSVLRRGGDTRFAQILRARAENTFGIAAASVHITRVQSSFRNAWITYRRLRFFVIGLFVTFMLELRYLLFLPGLVFALTFVAYYFSATYLANWKCPRCRQPFFRGSFIRSLFGGKCFYCDLPKWSATESANTLVSPKFPGRR